MTKIFNMVNNNSFWDGPCASRQSLSLIQHSVQDQPLPGKPAARLHLAAQSFGDLYFHEQGFVLHMPAYCQVSLWQRQYPHKILFLRCKRPGAVQVILSPPDAGPDGLFNM